MGERTAYSWSASIRGVSKEEVLTKLGIKKGTEGTVFYWQPPEIAKEIPQYKVAVVRENGNINYYLLTKKTEEGLSSKVLEEREFPATLLTRPLGILSPTEKELSLPTPQFDIKQIPVPTFPRPGEVRLIHIETEPSVEVGPLTYIYDIPWISSEENGTYIHQFFDILNQLDEQGRTAVGKSFLDFLYLNFDAVLTDEIVEVGKFEDGFIYAKRRCPTEKRNNYMWWRYDPIKNEIIGDYGKYNLTRGVISEFIATLPQPYKQIFEKNLPGG